MTTEHATSVLINPKNHLLNGRKLVVEYAGADAVRRGAPKAKREAGVDPPKRGESKSHGPRAERLQNRKSHDFSKDKAQESVAQSADVLKTQSRPTWRGADSDGRVPTGTDKKVKGPRVRPKPGAALALAKRETAAILPSQGKKITF
jgi:hypothetical protein